MKTTLLFLFLLPFTLQSQPQSKTTLRIALFAWLPEKYLMFQQLEQDFEQRYPNYDLELRPLDPYSNESYGLNSGIDALYQFDVVEIDYYRFESLKRAHPFGLDRIPNKAALPKDVVGGAAAIPEEHLDWFVPHWNCGAHLVYRVGSKVEGANSFKAMLKALDERKAPLNVNFSGRTTLGEYYTDAYLDTHGPEKTKAHLLELGAQGAAVLDPVH